MSRAATKWKRAGFDTPADYAAACARARAAKNDALRGSAARCGAARVLEYLVRRSEYHNMSVTTTKAQIAEDLRMCIKSVKRALATLRDEGTVEPILNAKGGKAPGGAGLPVVYLIVPQGARSLPERDDSGARAAPGKGASARQMTAEEARELSQLTAQHGWGEAQRILKARRGH